MAIHDAAACSDRDDHCLVVWEYESYTGTRWTDDVHGNLITAP